MRTDSSSFATLRGRDELTNQRPTVAVAGNSRFAGNKGSPHELSDCCSRSPNSILPLSSLRATIRTSTPLSCAAAGNDTTATLNSANTTPFTLLGGSGVAVSGLVARRGG